MKAFFAFTFSAWRAVSSRLRVERLLEQAVFAAALAWALGPFIRTLSLPYPLFLLCGLAPWYYFQEILRDLPLQMQCFPVRAANANPLFNVANHVICAMPTLLLWTAAAVVAALVSGGFTLRWVMIPYVLLCNVYNALMQGLMLYAFLPLFQGVAQTGLSITLPFLFWTVPIAWPLLHTSELVSIMTRLNPLYYLIELNRGLIDASAWPDASHATLFFLATTVVGVLGMVCAQRIWRLSTA